MGLWLSLTITLNVLSAVLILVVFALVKKQASLKEDIRRIQKEWVQWRAMTSSGQRVDLDPSQQPSEASNADQGHYVSERQVSEPVIDVSSLFQGVRPRATFGDDWKSSSSGGGIREKSAKSLNSESLGERPTDKFTKARELLRQGHGMKDVAVVTGLSYSELALLSKTESNL